MSQSLTATDTALLEKIADMKGGRADGAFNVRKDAGCAGRVNTKNVQITNKTDKPGIDVHFAPGCRETCHIPVIITQTGLRDTVYNDFYIGPEADVTIIAGCGIHNCGQDASEHDGVHTFYIGRGARVKYVEKHYGEGDGAGERIMNPETVAYLEEGAFLQMDTSQIAGIDSTRRNTKIVCGPGAEVVVTERLLTHGRQRADSDMEILLDGEDAKGRVISAVCAPDGGQRPVLRPRAVRLHHYGPGPHQQRAGDRRQQRGRPAHPRGRHRPHRRGPAFAAADPGPHGRGGGGAHPQGRPGLNGRGKAGPAAPDRTAPPYGDNRTAARFSSVFRYKWGSGCKAP